MSESMLAPMLVTRNCDVAPRSATAESLTTPSLCLDNLVLFPPNSQFKVETLVTSEPDKKSMLSQLAAYDMADLDVYVLRQIS